MVFQVGTETYEPLVFDVGSLTVKAGKAGRECPELTYPSALGRPKIEGLFTTYAGNDALAKSHMVEIEWPIRGGIVQEFDAARKVTEYAFHRLETTPDKHPIMTTETPFTPTQLREQTIEMYLEQWGAPYYYTSLQPVMALMAAGKETGIVVESGHSVTHIVPIIEGCPIAHAIVRLDVAGGDVTSYFSRLLTERGYYFDTVRLEEAAKAAKEDVCFAALDFEQAMAVATTTSKFERTVTLTGGAEIKLNDERFRCAEVMFSPKLVGLEFGGLAAQIQKSLQLCAIDVRKELVANIILSGGNTMFRGIGDRLHKELLALLPEASRPHLNVQQLEERRYLNWIGASLFASLDSFSSTAISKAQYDEHGAGIVHKRCYNAMLM